ncbi:hypothetical protein KDA23_00215 [Candidatus Saccharibacteria bacterium]|nr:hypothetical protein [Candidatus Saccharibacteria bacterium]
MKIKTLKFARPLYAVAALAMVLGLSASAVLPGVASAYGEVTDRAIKMSSSQQSATGVSYQVVFTTTSAAASIALDFCSASPLYADACTAPAGLNLSALVNGASDVTMTGGTTNDWDIINAATSASHLEIGGTSEAGSTTITLTLGGTHFITNPSALGSFYARIYTYSGNDPDWTAVATPGTVVDFGGIALSTAEAIDITARVQEKLQFCVSKADPTADCTGTSTPDLTLGHGSPQILDETAVDTDTAYIQVSTNAQSGVIIRMKNSNACGGLSRDGGSTCDIPAVNSGGNTAAALAAGTAEFGLRCTPAGTLTAAAPYATGGQYGMDTTTGGDNVTTTYGDTILSSAGAVNNQESLLTFGAAASLTTPAGVYTATMDLIATGTF